MKETVEAVKADLVARGLDLSGPCGAFAICKRVAWALRADGAGLLAKPSGNNCEGYATDVICYPDGRTFDILIDGGGQNGPTWEQHHPHDPSVAARYRPAFDPGDQPKPDPIVNKPDPTVVDLQALVAQINRIGARVDDIWNEVTATRAIAQAIYDKPAPTLELPPQPPPPVYETPTRFFGTVVSTPRR